MDDAHLTDAEMKVSVHSVYAHLVYIYRLDGYSNSVVVRLVDVVDYSLDHMSGHNADLSHSVVRMNHHIDLNNHIDLHNHIDSIVIGHHQMAPRHTL